MEDRLTPGYTALFYGPPGTGKTFSACLLGQFCQRDVYKIDLSLMVSKYIGETEKNLSRIFDTAENREWILFFDEADALFGKRTEVDDSRDRYANQEVSYLLQRIEEFHGVVILASNLKTNIDDAFIRRFQTIIPFPMPAAAERLRIWKQAFSERLRFANCVDLTAIADKYEVSGGTIMNLVRYCSLKAISQKTRQITLSDIEQGLKREFAKRRQAYLMQPAKVSRSATRVHLSQPKAVMRAAAQRQIDQEQQQSGLVRAALKSSRISSPDDPEEKEADNTAEKVMRMQLSPSAQGTVNHLSVSNQHTSRLVARQAENEEETIQRQSENEEEEVIQRKAEEEEKSIQRQAEEKEENVQRQAEEENEETIQRKAEGGVNVSANVQAEINSATSGGRPLPPSVRRFMEPRFNADFSNIRIHTDSTSGRLNKQLQARAFAYRNHVFFGDNQYQPDSDDGKRLIAHELTHSIQQGAAPQSEPSSVQQPLFQFFRSVTFTADIG